MFCDREIVWMWLIIIYRSISNIISFWLLFLKVKVKENKMQKRQLKETSRRNANDQLVCMCARVCVPICTSRFLQAFKEIFNSLCVYRLWLDKNVYACHFNIARSIAPFPCMFHKASTTSTTIFFCDALVYWCAVAKRWFHAIFAELSIDYRCWHIYRFYVHTPHPTHMPKSKSYPSDHNTTIKHAHGESARACVCAPVSKSFNRCFH